MSIYTRSFFLYRVVPGNLTLAEVLEGIMKIQALKPVFGQNTLICMTFVNT